MNHGSTIAIALFAGSALFACGDDATPDQAVEDRGTVGNTEEEERDAGKSPPPSTEEDAGAMVADAGRGEEDAAVADAGVEVDAGPTILAPSSAGNIVITEIHAAPLGYADDSDAEWIEVYNPSSDTTYDLEGCVFADKLGDADYVLKPGLLIAPSTSLVLSSATFTIPTHGFVSDDVYGADGTGLSGGGDGPNIVCKGVVIDIVDYSAAGFPSAEALEGHALQLDKTKLDAAANDVGTHWCHASDVYVTANGEENFGTPRATNRTCP